MRKKFLASLLLVLSLIVGITLVAPNSTNANNNMVLASVEWVQAQLNPVNTKISQLETKIAIQEQQIKDLQEAVFNGNAPTPTPVPGEVTTFPSTIYTSKSSVTLHSGATRNYKVVATLPAGKALTTTEKFVTSTGTWYRVNVTSTLKGWVLSTDMTTVKPTNFVPTEVVVKSSTNVRAGATTQYKIVENVSAGTSMKYLGIFRNSLGETWYNVQTPNGNKGWVLSTLTEVK